jgi:hypothetical protein
MEVKIFEILDAGTFIPAIGVLLEPVSANPFEDLNANEETAEAERYLLRRLGFPVDPKESIVNLTRLSDGETHYDPYHWPNRTMATAHKHISVNWKNLASGDVVDVQFILGEMPTPKMSERLTALSQIRKGLGKP